MQLRLMVAGVLAFWMGAFAGGQTALAGKVPMIAPIKIDKTSKGWNYMGDSSPENLKRLAAAGVNTVSFWVGHYQPDNPPYNVPEWWTNAKSMKMLADACRRAKAAGMDVVLMTNLGWGQEVYPQVKLAPSKNFKGEGERSPSWMDPTFWNKIVIPRDKALAGLVKAGVADAVLLEPEVYADGALIERGQLDYGDVAYSRFAKAVGLRGGLPEPKDRAANLQTSGLIGLYAEWQIAELKRFATQWKNALRSVAPNVTLGYYNPGTTSWSLRSLAQGLYEPGRPLLIMDAMTYGAIAKDWFLNFEIASMTEYGAYRSNVFKRWGVEAQAANGIYTFPTSNSTTIWKRNSNAETITEFLRTSRRLGHGWWIWNELGDTEKVLECIRKSNAKE